MSLSNLLDIPQVQDFLRGLMNTMNEYDQAKEEPDRQPKIVSFHPTIVGRSLLTVGPSGYSGPKSQNGKLLAVSLNILYHIRTDRKHHTSFHLI